MRMSKRRLLLRGQKLLNRRVPLLLPGVTLLENLSDLLPRIRASTLIIAGRQDHATPVEAGEYIRSHIPGASMTLLDAAHISNVEQPHDFTEAVMGFLMQN